MLALSELYNVLAPLYFDDSSAPSSPPVGELKDNLKFLEQHVADPDCKRVITQAIEGNATRIDEIISRLKLLGRDAPFIEALDQVPEEAHLPTYMNVLSLFRRQNSNDLKLPLNIICKLRPDERSEILEEAKALCSENPYSTSLIIALLSLLPKNVRREHADDVYRLAEALLSSDNQQFIDLIAEQAIPDRARSIRELADLLESMPLVVHNHFLEKLYRLPQAIRLEVLILISRLYVEGDPVPLVDAIAANSDSASYAFGLRLEGYSSQDLASYIRAVSLIGANFCDLIREIPEQIKHRDTLERIRKLVLQIATPVDRTEFIRAFRGAIATVPKERRASFVTELLSLDMPNRLQAFVDSCVPREHQAESFQHACNLATAPDNPFLLAAIICSNSSRGSLARIPEEHRAAVVDVTKKLSRYERASAITSLAELQNFDAIIQCLGDVPDQDKADVLATVAYLSNGITSPNVQEGFIEIVQELSYFLRARLCRLASTLGPIQKMAMIFLAQPHLATVSSDRAKLAILTSFQLDPTKEWQEELQEARDALPANTSRSYIALFVSLLCNTSPRDCITWESRQEAKLTLAMMKTPESIRHAHDYRFAALLQLVKTANCTQRVILDTLLRLWGSDSFRKLFETLEDRENFARVIEAINDIPIDQQELMLDKLAKVCCYNTLADERAMFIRQFIRFSETQQELLLVDAAKRWPIIRGQILIGELPSFLAQADSLDTMSMQALALHRQGIVSPIVTVLQETDAFPILCHVCEPHRVRFCVAMLQMFESLMTRDEKIALVTLMAAIPLYQNPLMVGTKERWAFVRKYIPLDQLAQFLDLTIKHFDNFFRSEETTVFFQALVLMPEKHIEYAKPAFKLSQHDRDELDLALRHLQRRNQPQGSVTIQDGTLKLINCYSMASIIMDARNAMIDCRRAIDRKISLITTSRIFASVLRLCPFVELQKSFQVHQSIFGGLIVVLTRDEDSTTLGYDTRALVPVSCLEELKVIEEPVDFLEAFSHLFVRNQYIKRRFEFTGDLCANNTSNFARLQKVIRHLEEKEIAFEIVNSECAITLISNESLMRGAYSYNTESDIVFISPRVVEYPLILTPNAISQRLPQVLSTMPGTNQLLLRKVITKHASFQDAIWYSFARPVDGYALNTTIKQVVYINDFEGINGSYSHVAIVKRKNNKGYHAIFKKNLTDEWYCLRNDQPQAQIDSSEACYRLYRLLRKFKENPDVSHSAQTDDDVKRHFLSMLDGAIRNGLLFKAFRAIDDDDFESFSYAISNLRQADLQTLLFPIVRRARVRFFNTLIGKIDTIRYTNCFGKTLFTAAFRAGSQHLLSRLHRAAGLTRMVVDGRDDHRDERSSLRE